MAFAHMKTQWFSGFFFVAHVKTQAELAISGRWPSNGYSRQYCVSSAFLIYMQAQNSPWP